MSSPPPVAVSRVRGPSWIGTAVLAWTVNPIVLMITVWPTGFGRDCSPTPAGEVPRGCPREGLVWLAGMLMLALWVLLTGLVGLVLGAVEGAHQRFVKDHVVPAVLV